MHVVPSCRTLCWKIATVWPEPRGGLGRLVALPVPAGGLSDPLVLLEWAPPSRPILGTTRRMSR